MAQGQFSHLELPADDTARARRFYEGVFGWELGEVPDFPNYLLFSFGTIESSGGAIGLRGQTAGNEMRVYIGVDSIDETLPKIESLGGKITMGKTEIPGQGWYAMFHDTEGNQLALYENMRNSAM
jgi:predicted enzyme related to lactoylglutathione lyase